MEESKAGSPTPHHRYTPPPPPPLSPPTTTELESGGGDSPPYSFATDLLGAFGACRKKNEHTLKVLEELATMIKTRAGIEDDYSNKLTKVVQHHSNSLLRFGEALARKAGSTSFAEEVVTSPTAAGGGGGGAGASSLTTTDTFRECIETLKADMLNKAVQRKQLATSILTEVFEPVEEVYNQIALQSKDMESHVSALAREARTLDARYRTAHKKFEHATNLATNTCKALVDQGGQVPTMDVHILYKKHAATPRETPPPSSPFDLKKEELSSLMAGSPKRISAAIAKADLTSWLLPTEKDKHQQDMQAAARNHLEIAELARFACRDRYEELAAFARQATHQLQRLLCQYQLCEERCVDELAVVLRKQVVFESSCLANEQYEAQVIFKVIEAVDKDRDLEAFIHLHKTQYPGAEMTNVLKSLGLLATPLPSPPPAVDNDASSMNIDTLPISPVLKTADLPNLSSPSPHVVPAATVMRLLLGGTASRNNTPPPPPPPSSSAVAPAPAPLASIPLAPVSVPLPVALASAAEPKAPKAATPPPPLAPVRSPVFQGAIQEDIDDEEEDDDEDDDEEAEEKPRKPAPTHTHTHKTSTPPPPALALSPPSAKPPTTASRPAPTAAAQLKKEGGSSSRPSSPSPPAVKEVRNKDGGVEYSL